jgi:mannose-6-phosphate isomerase-like protein (cupin superfamily)
MKSKTCKLTEGFRIAFECRGVQAAEMVIAPGEREGGPENFHAGADQWLFVVAGTGLAIVERSRRKLVAGSLLLIERGERHEIRNTGRSALVTMNVYAPAAYARDGTLKRTGKPAGTRRRDG